MRLRLSKSSWSVGWLDLDELGELSLRFYGPVNGREHIWKKKFMGTVATEFLWVRTPSKKFSRADL